jgi:hypothetical protein
MAVGTPDVSSLAWLSTISRIHDSIKRMSARHSFPRPSSQQARRQEASPDFAFSISKARCAHNCRSCGLVVCRCVQRTRCSSSAVSHARLPPACTTPPPCQPFQSSSRFLTTRLFVRVCLFLCVCLPTCCVFVRLSVSFVCVVTHPTDGLGVLASCMCMCVCSGGWVVFLWP